MNFNLSILMPVVISFGISVILCPIIIPFLRKPAGIRADAGFLKDAMRDYEKDFIQRVLAQNRGNITKTAEELGIARKNLYKKLNDYGIRYKD